jgi:hypothetical protein
MPGGHRRAGEANRWWSRAIVAGVLGMALALAAAAAVWSSTAADQRVVRGTKKADTLVGSPGSDLMFGYRGNDWLRGLGGNDVLVGGPGRDTLSGGPGRDLIRAQEGARDHVYCGPGEDTVVADRLDLVYGGCETVRRPGKPPIPRESRTDCATTNYSKWTWEQCKPGTTITVVNEGWHCDRPLATYGPLPIKVISMSTVAWNDAAPVTVNSGCTGSPGSDVNLIVDIRGSGPRSSVGPGVDAFKTRQNPQDLRITGSIQCGRRAPNAHQDAIQIQGGTNIVFVNVEAGGDYDAGLSTCQGAGGGPFYSVNRITNVDVLGGKYIACNHALNGSNASDGDDDVIDARFRSGRNDGSDPNCSFASSPPCVNTSSLRLQNVTCELWRAGRWVEVPPR